MLSCSPGAEGSHGQNRTWPLFAVLILTVYPFVAGNEASTQPLNFSGRKPGFPGKILPACLHFSLHGMSDCHGFALRQPKTCNFAQSVMQSCPASIGSHS